MSGGTAFTLDDEDDVTSAEPASNNTLSTQNPTETKDGHTLQPSQPPAASSSSVTEEQDPQRDDAPQGASTIAEAMQHIQRNKERVEEAERMLQVSMLSLSLACQLHVSTGMHVRALCMLQDAIAAGTSFVQYR